MKLILVAGTRPNFVKIAPLIHAIQKHSPAIDYRLVHTGQHYDKQLDAIFFKELNIPEPHVNFAVQSGTHAVQTGAIMVKFEEYLQQEPGIVVVVGDVNSTMACGIVAKKLNLPLVHVEAGIRSGDLSMPEEINRLVTDAITDHFYTTSSFANDNLKKAGIEDHRIHFVGNVMIDTLLANQHQFRQPACWTEQQLNAGDYWLLTLHRPSNVDDPEKLKDILTTIERSCSGKKVIFPVHPRTRKRLSDMQYSSLQLHLTDSMGYLEFMFMIRHAQGVITDSGGIQEETTVMSIPCLTLRANTERPETVSIGTNELLEDYRSLPSHIEKVLTHQWKKGSIPPLWDGKASERIIQSLYQLYAN
ncbi:MAG: UDP-N-acetylglucosamine 2-epimerase (non-hydrolyzing) [Cytophagaceae bacterium]|jgi:UDP-N-acetylglucosamine 2-epimerase (non-hydrolysing)|nr:UDP-N-acetylglucosamine 2-epimerase (non-hydrolyzing) [Cytophagaceae bacterium]